MNDNNTLAYSFHLGSDKNKKSSVRSKAKTNASGSTSLSNNAIQNVKQLGKVNHHNLRMYDNNQELIKSIKGSSDIVKDVKELYLNIFEESKINYNDKQSRNDRKIDNYFNKISEDTKHDLACEVIIELGDMKFWENKDKEYKYKMINVFNDQVKDLENVVPNFKIANATIHFDESSPHLHIIGVPYKTNCKTGMTTQVGKSDVFTKDSLTIIQDKMRVLCINSFNNVYGKEHILKEKQRGKNRDIPSSEMAEYKQKTNELKSNLTNLETLVKTIEKSKDIMSDELKKLDKEKDSIKKEINKKKITNAKAVLSYKGNLYDENKRLKDELDYEKHMSYQYKQQYESLKEKNDYLLEQLKKVINKLPEFIKTIIDKLFTENYNLKFFKRDYDEDYKKAETRKWKSIISKNNNYNKTMSKINKKMAKTSEDFYSNKKEKDDFEL